MGEALHNLARAYQAVPAGEPSTERVIEKLPALYAAVDAVLADTSRIEGLLSTVDTAERDGLTVHVATRATCAEHIAAGDDKPSTRPAIPEPDDD